MQKNPNSVTTGDFNGDGKTDLATANYGSNTVSVLLGTGTGTFGAKTDNGIGTNPISVTSGDFNRDGYPDLVTANNIACTVSILLNTTTPITAAVTFATKTDYSTGTGPGSMIHRAVATDDFNRDGKLDLATANASADNISILLGTGDGIFGTKMDYSAGNGTYLVATGDFNKDGKADLAAANGGTNTASILLGTGDGTFGTKTDYTVGTNPYSIARRCSKSLFL